MSKRWKRRYPPFVMIEKETLKRPEWKGLSHTTKLIYIYLKANFNGANNGKIPFRYSLYKDEFSPATISKALKKLEADSWIEKTRYGGMFRYYCEYSVLENRDRHLFLLAIGTVLFSDIILNFAYNLFTEYRICK